MKRSKILLSVLAAAVFATSAGALVACGDVEIPIKPAEKPSESQTTEYTVTFSGLTGANATKTTVGGKLTGTMPTATAPEGKEFKGWALTQNASSAAIRTDNYKTYPFTGTTTTITLYPVFADKQQEEDPPVENPPASEEYTVTFSGLTGANATKTTVGGKLIGTMPTAPEPEGKEFKGWALTQNANSAAIRTDNYTTYSFTGTTTTITLYPVFADKQQVEDPPTTDEFTITFDLGDYGTTDDETEVTTVNGKITAFPRVKPETGYRFDCWMMGNKEVDESTVFTDDATVYAQYDDSDEVESDGELLVNGQRKLYLTDNTENIQAPIEGNTATYEYMATGVELSPGEVVTFRIKGKVLVDHPNAADGDRLWDTDKRHGVTFNQATGEFKVKSNAGSSFNIYVRYYNTGTDAAHPCWSIEFTDGEPDELVDGGLYLVGSGFENAQWGPTPELYIDPDEGLLITFSSGNQIKACHCDGENAVWDMGEPAKYKEVGGNNIDFSTVDADYGNANVTGSGTYTYKVTVENGIVVFTLVA